MYSGHERYRLGRESSQDTARGAQETSSRGWMGRMIELGEGLDRYLQYGGDVYELDS